MRKSKGPAVSQPLLARIDRLFRAFRRRRTGCRLTYPAKLKRLAVEATRGGCSAADVAHSAGVSEQSISNWLKEHQENTPQELTVISETTLAPSSVVAPALSLSPTARIHLPSGVTIEVPTEALTPSLVGVFSQGGHVV